MDKNAVFNMIDSKKDELFGLLSSFIWINSESHRSYGNEEELARNIYNLCKELGLESELYSPLDIDGFENHVDYMPGDSLICAGKESAMCAIYTLLQEICEMFPNSPFIHIGGDEADIKLWNECSVCREYMKQKNIGDEYELYSEFIARVAKLVLQLGKTPIVWEGFPKQGEKMIPRETIVMAWESHYHMPYDLIDEGFKIINCSWQPLYIVNSLEQRWNPLDIMRWNVYNWQHWWSESEAYLNPVNIAPTENVLGAQLCAWESTYEQEINFIMENLAALSERTWNVKRVCCDDEFKTKHKKLMQIVARLITSK